MQMIGILWLKGLRGGSGDDVECTKRKKHIGLDYYLHAMQVRIVITIWQSMPTRREYNYYIILQMGGGGEVEGGRRQVAL